MPSSAKLSLEAWNKKLHIYLGLYFLFFLWLFAPLWLVLRRREGSRAEALCLVFAWVYFFYWGSVWPVVRYAIVPLGLLTILIGIVSSATVVLGSAGYISQFLDWPKAAIVVTVAEKMAIATSRVP